MHRKVERKNIHKEEGFTLIELSITLVLIGLIVGSIVGGKSLLRQAELRSIVTGLQQYLTAVNTFQLQYDEFPGDFPIAQDYWGTSVSNGNGDGLITSEPPLEEELLAFTHLVAAGITNGQFTGELENGQYVVGVNIPPTRITGVGFGITNVPSSINNPPLIPTVYGRQGLFIGIGSSAMNADLTGPAISARDAASIDKKVDNGAPDSGKFYAINATTSTKCVDQPVTASSASYRLDQTEPACILGMWVY